MPTIGDAMDAEAARMSEAADGPWRAVRGEGDEGEWGIVTGDGFVIALLGFKGPDAEMVATLIARAPSAEADADRTAGALEALGQDDDGWHYFACPTRHNFLDCDAKCIAARKALRLHKEHR